MESDIMKYTPCVFNTSCTHRDNYRLHAAQGALDASNGVILSRVGDGLCRGGRAAGNRGARSSSTSSNDDAKKKHSV